MRGWRAKHQLVPNSVDLDGGGTLLLAAYQRQKGYAFSSPCNMSFAKTRARPIPRPFLKWAGGKTNLLPVLLAHVPPAFGGYWEPFLGGGALFFALYRAGRLRAAVLSDINAELIDTYRAIQQEVTAVIAHLNRYPHNADFYYALRARDPWQMPRAERAARMIYLNKTGYNGLYRVNKRGQFNVPFGRYKHPNYRDVANLQAVSQALQIARLEVHSFEWVVDACQPGDFVYFDPPYDPVSATARFTQYHASGFGRAEQRRLAEVFVALGKKGVRVMLSNADTPFIRDLYAGRGHLIAVQAPRFINSKGRGRGPQPELLILNYPPAAEHRLSGADSAYAG